MSEPESRNACRLLKDDASLNPGLFALEPAIEPKQASRSAGNTTLKEIFAREYRRLRPRAAMPAFDVRFYPYTGLNTTIRLRGDKALVRLSDMLEVAPETVLAAIAHILLAKLYRKPVEPAQADRYRRHLASDAVARRAEQVRRSRGRKNVVSPQGRYFNLEEVFDELNRRFFGGLMGRPVLTWSAHAARRMLGHYDAAHNTIVVSRVFDRADTPRCAVEYLVFHEMLHLRHPVRVRGGRRCVHSREFQRDEKLFPELAEAKEFLKRL